MSEAVFSPKVEVLAPPVMITLRAKPATPGLAEAVLAATGCALPEARAISRAGEARCAWMSPDEYLLVVPVAARAEALAALSAGLEGQHHLVADVSDARVFYRVSGAGADQVLMRLTPADVTAVGADEIRRSRLAQVAFAFWPEEGGYHLVAFRSVGPYVDGLLRQAAASVAACEGV